MTVEEINLYCLPCCRLHRTPLDREVPLPPIGWEGHTVGKWLPTGGSGFPMPSPTRFHPMLRLHVDHQQPQYHLLPELCALNPTPLTLLVGRPCSHYLSPVRRLRLRSRRLARAADHSNCITNFGIQDHPV